MLEFLAPGKRVLTQDSYRENAHRLQAAIDKADRVKRAADIVEKTMAPE
jgi:UDP:flavonoid glycosyltransferase YjiC (YdhE family)